jgi:hypothetical protein
LFTTVAVVNTAVTAAIAAGLVDPDAVETDPA